ncbi:hypothetical protein O2K51_08005 [Apibacter raozihei]|nr:hypothetical protein [Apibacter raozihei]
MGNVKYLKIFFEKAVIGNKGNKINCNYYGDAIKQIVEEFRDIWK